MFGFIGGLKAAAWQLLAFIVALFLVFGAFTWAFHNKNTATAVAGSVGNAAASVVIASANWVAAQAGGMERQTLRDWVIRFNDAGPEGLSNKSSPGAPGKLTSKHKEFLARLIDEGPVPAIDGVVRWRACDLLRQLHAAFGLSVSDATVYRALKELGFSHVSARPKAYKQDPEAMAAFKKISPGAWRRSARNSRRAHR